MKTESKNNLPLTSKEVVVLTIVVSFIVSVIAGFVAGGLGYQLIKTREPVAVEQKQEPAAGSESASNQEETIVKAVKEAAPAVVSIIITKDIPVIEQYYQEYNPFGNDEFFRRFFGDESPFNFQIPQYRQKGTEKKEVGGGTGFVVFSSPAGGSLVLTNKHVVFDQEADYTILTNDGERISVKSIIYDSIQDIAVLKIDKNNLPIVRLGDSDKIEIGQTVIAIGNALGEFRNTVSVGVVSGLKRSISASSGLGETEQLSEVIQTDAAINPGNSGGPLLNLRGEAVGVNVAMAQGAENIAFALPINKIKRSISQAESQGRIAYPFLGVRYVMITPEIKEKNNLSVDYGALLVKGDKANEPAIEPGSPAEKAGLTEGDIILEIDNQKINQENPLAEVIQNYKPGDKVVLKIIHQGESKAIEVVLVERE